MSEPPPLHVQSASPRTCSGCSPKECAGQVGQAFEASCTRPAGSHTRPTERLAGEVAALAHESKTHAVRVALRERKVRLQAARRGRREERLRRFLHDQAWPQVVNGWA
ncbi:type II toxin-antitoxin system VapB family antitoxin [Nonomuraea sp. NBC_00507]|uniref:type II toxin-antitoxin system VapB family antitoxin n=1 Tax=Nonomuraea sp. NBC_00507 TaxID=2976002 RepID=UPI003FA582B7